MTILMDGSAESIVPTDVEAGDPVRIIDRRRQRGQHAQCAAAARHPGGSRPARTPPSSVTRRQAGCLRCFGAPGLGGAACSRTPGVGVEELLANITLDRRGVRILREVFVLPVLADRPYHETAHQSPDGVTGGPGKQFTISAGHIGRLRGWCTGHPRIFTRHRCQRRPQPVARRPRAGVVVRHVIYVTFHVNSSVAAGSRPDNYLAPSTAGPWI